MSRYSSRCQKTRGRELSSKRDVGEDNEEEEDDHKMHLYAWVKKVFVKQVDNDLRRNGLAPKRHDHSDKDN